MCVSVSLCVSICTCTCTLHCTVHTCSLYMYVCVCVSVNLSCTCTHNHLCVCTHVHIHVCVHVYKYVYTICFSKSFVLIHTFSSDKQDLREIINKLENLLLVFLLNQIWEDLLTYILISHVLLIQKISNLYSM